MIDNGIVVYFHIDEQTLLVACEAHAHTTALTLVHEFKWCVV